MICGFSIFTIAVPDLAIATQQYGALLGAFESRADGASLALANVRIRLVEDPGLQEAVIRQVALWSDGAAFTLPSDTRRLDLSVTRDRDVGRGETETGIVAVDHIVLRTRDADDCIRLFGDDLGMRLALDQAVPEWGGRMLFFRCGKLTLEVIQHLEDPVEKDHFWGITYLCQDLEGTLSRLDAAGVAHSKLRQGRKPGTLVATVKSHDLGLPTLLIQPANR